MITTAMLTSTVRTSLQEEARLTFATTHYAELKTIARADQRFATAAVGFDTAALRPTYELQVSDEHRCVGSFLICVVTSDSTSGRSQVAHMGHASCIVVALVVNLICRHQWMEAPHCSHCSCRSTCRSAAAHVWRFARCWTKLEPWDLRCRSQWGEVGESNALDIARGLGLPTPIYNAARELMEQEVTHARTAEQTGALMVRR